MLNSIIQWRSKVRWLFFLGLFAAAYFYMPFSWCSYLKIGYLRLICPLGFIENMLAAKSTTWPLFGGFIVIVILTSLLGRFMCAWFCPASFSGDQMETAARRLFASSLVKRFDRNWNKLNKALGRFIQLDFNDGVAIFIGIAAGIVAFGYPAFCLICPIGVLSRNVIELVVHQNIRWDIILLLIPVIAGLFFKNGWKCTCTLGVVNGLLATNNKRWLPKVNSENCNACKRCKKQCSSGQNPVLEVDTQMCNKCFECVTICPKDALTPSWRDPENFVSCKTGDMYD